MDRAVFLVLDPRPESRVVPELQRRYGSDYEILAEGSTAAGLERLEGLRRAGREVAIAFAEFDVPELGGTEFLTRVHDILPRTKRALLVDVGDISCAGTLLQALTFKQADDYIRSPYQSPDEQFHLAVSTLLEEWAQANRGRFQLVRIIGEQWAPRSYELRDMMERAGIPSVFFDVRSQDGRDLLAAVGLGSERLPVCVLYNAEVLVDPSDAELDEAIGVRTHPDARRYDLVIVGAGPAGLSAAVYASSEGLDTVVVEPQAPGGQAGTSSMVRNYLGFPRGISGGELMRAAYRQAWLFQTQFVFSHQAVGLSPGEAEQVVELAGGETVRGRAVLLATGIAYRRLGIATLDRLIGAGVYYGTAVSEAQAMRGRRVFVVGAGNSAGQAAVHLSKYAEEVTVLVRGSSMAGSMSHYLVQEISDTPNIRVRCETEVVDGAGDYLLERLRLRDRASGTEEEVEAGALFILIGGAPHSAWLPPALRRDAQGYIVTGRDVLGEGVAQWPLARAPLPFETSIPGVFAAGDVRYGSAKRIAGAVGEGSGAIQFVHKLLAGI